MRSFRLLSVFSKCAVLSALLHLGSAAAVVNVDRTRVIFSNGQHTQALSLYNDSTLPAIVQIWTDSGEIAQSPATIKTPVIAMPPLLKMQPKEVRSIKLLLNETKSSDGEVEKMLWLNIFQISPSASDEAKSKKLDLPLRFRMKVFLRSKKVGSPVAADYQKLRYEIADNHLYIVNPTPWHMSLSVGYSDGSTKKNIVCAPLSRLLIDDFQVNGNLLPANFLIVNDAGNTLSVAAKKR